MGSKLLVLSKRPEDQLFAQEVANLVDLSLEVVFTEKEAVEVIERDEAAVIFVDGSTEEQYQAFETAIQSRIGLFSDKVNANFIHYISGSDLQKVQYLLESPIFGHFISRNFDKEVREAATRYSMLLKATRMDRAFNLKNLVPEATKIQSIQFKNTSQKQQGVEAVKNFLLAAKFKNRMATVIANAVDELLMNAMFDAPVDSLGKPMYDTTPRDTAIELAGSHLVELMVAFDGNYVAVTAVDHFGSLDKAKLFSHISKRYIEEEYKVKNAVAGAGIGLATIFRSGGSFFFSSESRVRTEVTVFFKRAENFRDFKDQFRFISTQFYF